MELVKIHINGREVMIERAGAPGPGCIRNETARLALDSIDETEWVDKECRTGGPMYRYPAPPWDEGNRTGYGFMWPLCSGSACGHWLWTRTRKVYLKEGALTESWRELPREEWHGRCGLINPEPVEG